MSALSEQQAFRLLSSSDQPIDPYAPLQLAWPVLTAPGQIVSWDQWQNAEHGKPVPWQVGWGNVLPGNASTCCWNLFRDEAGLHLMLMIDAPVDWSADQSILNVGLDIERSHRNVIVSTLNPTREPIHKSMTACRGELPWDLFDERDPLSVEPTYKQSIDSQGRWFISITWDHKSAPGVMQAPNIGLNLQLQGKVEGDILDAIALATDNKQWACPWRFASVAVQVDAVHLAGLWMERPNYYRSPCRFKLHNQADKQASGVLRVHVAAEDYEHTLDTPFKVDARESTNVECIILPSQLAYRNQQIHVQVIQEEQVTWRGTFRAGNGISPNQVGHVLHLHHVAPPDGIWPNPINKQIARRQAILEKLPHLRREPTPVLCTERLVSEDSSIDIDLRDNDALARLAYTIGNLFEDEDEKLAGLCLLVHQCLFYSARSAQIASAISPLAILRLGGSICSGFTQVLRGLIETLIDPRTGNPYHCIYHNTGASHVILTVVLGERIALLDPTLGVMHFDESTGKLCDAATLAVDCKLVRSAVVGRDDDYLKPEAAYRLHSGRGTKSNKDIID